MLERMIDIAFKVTKLHVDTTKTINIHHNYCSCETCQVYDPKSKSKVLKDLWITRKGATSAKKDEYGIIPGSMGVGSYIVKGKGNPQSWSSCSHGAGRRLSRVKAKN
jgi:tRNA-splicing ligase RtcB (3'-phosphate/5'-hydroxy nucleic acid ligase)